MTAEQRRKNLCPPRPGAHVVLDTDTYNEIDDQFALSWLMLSPELNTKALYAAPFFNENSTGPEDGMRRSYEEIHKLLGLLGRDAPVFLGSPRYLPDEKSPVPSPAAEDLARRAEGYSPENPLYVAAIGAITNVASAILLNPRVAENTVVVWLGGNGRHWPDGREFNLSRGGQALHHQTGAGALAEGQEPPGQLFGGEHHPGGGELWQGHGLEPGDLGREHSGLAAG